MAANLQRNEIPRDPATLLRFATGGRAVLTMSNEATGRHVTFKLALPKVPKINFRTGRPWPKALFVRIFTGTRPTTPGQAVSNSQRDYVYVGKIDLENERGQALDKPSLNLSPYKLRSAGIGIDDVRVRGIRHLVDLLRGDATQSSDLTIWHEGRCCFCGLALTQTESVKRGYGRACAGQRGLPYGKPTKYAKGTGVGVTTADAYRIACPHCTSLVGERCQDPKGNRRGPHSRRKKLAGVVLPKPVVIVTPEPTVAEFDGEEFTFVDDDEILEGDDLVAPQVVN